jgi:phosphate transport system regulatory protein PhoU
MSDEKTTRHFIEELQRLKERLLEMGDLATSRIDRAVSGLTSRDPVILGDVIQGDESINALQIELDDRCFKLLALRQPMATDLRLIMSTTRITSDLERVGDLAVNVAEAAARYIQYPPVKPLIDLPKMSEFAQQMLRDALSSFVSGEVSLASDVLKRDDALDDLKRQVFQDLLTYMLNNPDLVAPALDLVLISRHLERVGDHATNIAEDIIFLVEGRDVRHQTSRFAAS